MAQTLFGSNATPSLPLLDANFTELYSLYNLWSISGLNLGLGTTATSVAKLTLGGALQIAGAAVLPATTSPGLYSLESAVLRQYLGDGTGYDFRMSIRVGSVTTDRFIFSDSGTMTIGATPGGVNPGISLSMAGQISAGNAAGASGFAFASFFRSNAGVGSITQSGTTAVLYNTTSDKRLKTNIADAADAGAIIDAIKVRAFDWRDAANEHVTHGFVAQELVTVAPQAVKVGDSDSEVSDVWAVDPSKLMGLVIKEMQSMRARLAAAGI